MNTIFAFGAGVLSAGVILLAGFGGTQDNGGAQMDVTDSMKAQFGDAMADPRAGMQRWMEACRVGPAHEMLAPNIGEWDIVQTVNAGGHEMTSKGTSTIRWLHEGRWLIEELQADMMGQPVTRTLITGFDNFKRKYVSMGLDSSSTAMVTMSGNFDRDGKVLTMFGLMDEPMTGEHDKTVKAVSRWIDEDHAVVEIQEVLYGDPFTVVKVEYTRRK